MESHNKKKHIFSLKRRSRNLGSAAPGQPTPDKTDVQDTAAPHTPQPVDTENTSLLAQQPSDAPTETTEASVSHEVTQPKPAESSQQPRTIPIKTEDEETAAYAVPAENTNTDKATIAINPPDTDYLEPVSVSSDETIAASTSAITEEPVTQRDLPILTNEPSEAFEDDDPTASQRLHGSAIAIVWQWLTYALWFGVLVLLGTILTATIAYFVDDTLDPQDFSWVIYCVAALVCLLPAAYIVDRGYRRLETPVKHGFAAVIMVIHAVTAFLTGLGSLITAVVVGLSLATDISGQTTDKWISIVAATVVALLSAFFFIRITRPRRFGNLPDAFAAIIAFIVTVAIAVTCFGPLSASVRTKQDRFIDDNLWSISDAINKYARQNQKLPASLDTLNKADLSDDKEAKKLLQDRMVEYKITQQVDDAATTNPKKTELNQTANQTMADKTNATAVINPTQDPYANELWSETDNYNSDLLPYAYQLCVRYKAARGSGVINQDASNGTYLDTHNHPAGYSCYQITNTAL